ncbi:hypothetical protein [Haloarchaeobius iranensis]|uniref:Uncharacterized protein n=1 Tax=Haloarchaeobius iranensis TaxID=996166 RepID=A0A1G9YEV8_9EURY|nr:hypothetical protein [Haloarchaeobius iranensis]SDN07045.1 hypothetical protein SAMN05192554_1143 [Haloarchaeobius iranensis]
MQCEHCSADVEFWVYEQYLSDDGVGAVERSEAVCSECVKEVEPEALDQAHANYEYRIEPDPEAFGMSRIGE